MADYSYIGVGKVYLKEVGSAAGLVEVGNATDLSFSVSEDTKELKDFTQTGGGTYNEVRRVSSVEMKLTMSDYSPANLAKALFGTASAATGASVTNEAHTAYKGALVRLSHPNPTAVTVTGPSGTPTYVLNTDYEVRPEGIFIVTAGAIANAASIEVDYTYSTYDVVQALTSGAKEYELSFGGLNEARSGKSVIVDAFRVKIGAAANISLIGEDYGALEVSGKLLKDTTKGAGLSQYFKVSIQQ